MIKFELKTYDDNYDNEQIISVENIEIKSSNDEVKIYFKDKNDTWRRDLQKSNNYIIQVSIIELNFGG